MIKLIIIFAVCVLIYILFGIAYTIKLDDKDFFALNFTKYINIAKFSCVFLWPCFVIVIIFYFILGLFMDEID